MVRENAWSKMLENTDSLHICFTLQEWLQFVASIRSIKTRVDTYTQPVKYATPNSTFYIAKYYHLCGGLWITERIKNVENKRDSISDWRHCRQITEPSNSLPYFPNFDKWMRFFSQKAPNQLTIKLEATYAKIAVSVKQMLAMEAPLGSRFWET